MKMKINIAYAEDHKLVRQNLISTLEEYDIFTVIESENGLALMDKLKHITPDVLLLDVDMPEMDGCETLEKIKELYPKMKVIMLTMHGDTILKKHLYEMGASAFLTKNSDIELVVDTIRSVHKNKFVSNDKSLLQKKENEASIKFSKRESEVSLLIIKGKSNKEIADKLNITNKTVEAHKKNLFNKTNTQSAVGYVSYVLQKGLNYLR